MHFVLFYHSLLSDWNHGNAHFLRGIVTELQRRGHRVTVYEPAHNWSLENLVAEHGQQPVRDFQAAFPQLQSHFYRLEDFQPDRILADADVVIVHEWNDTKLVRQLGDHRRRRGRYILLFHDTHHRSVSDRAGIAAYQTQDYDGVLAFGRVVRDRYLQQRWARRAWVWHEAADTTIFHPRQENRKDGDLVWVGNWGDDERVAELDEFLFEPVKALGLAAMIHGVRYPAEALQKLQDAAIDYRGWLPNYRVPEVFARYKLTVHVPRRPYVTTLPGVPTIRVFEALACGIPLISAPWHDVEALFTPGKDFLVARNGDEMKAQMRFLLNEPDAARALAEHGLATIRARHTCAHRVDELLEICVPLAAERNQPSAISAAKRHLDLPIGLHTGSSA